MSEHARPRAIASAVSPEARLGLFYALTFGGIGIASPYFALWLASRGVAPEVTGAIAASPSIAMLATTLLFGGIADRLADWRTAIIAGCWIMCAAFAGLFLVDDTAMIWVLWTLGGLFLMGVMPIADGATLSLTRRRGTQYGPIRAMGSAGFIVGITLGGLLQERFGPGVFVFTLVGTALGRAFAAVALPRFRAPASAVAAPPDATATSAPSISATSAPPAAPAAAASRALLRHPGFLMVIVGAALINASHAFLNTFSLLHWTRIGISEATGSLLWTVSVVVEIALLWRFEDVAKRVSARKCLLFAGLVAAFRWTLTGTDPSLVLLVPLQALHAISFGLAFIASVSFISRRIDDAYAARAQALLATITTGCMAALTLLSGWLYDYAGSRGYWAMACVCLLGTALVAASFRSDLEDLPAPATA